VRTFNERLKKPARIAGEKMEIGRGDRMGRLGEWRHFLCAKADDIA
jgi:hypothetical protein